MSNESDRRAFLAQVAALGVSSTFIGARANDTPPRQPGRISTDMLRQAATVTGQTFTDRELEALLNAANENVTRYEALDRATLDHGVPPPLYFNPVVPGMTIDRVRRGSRPAPSPRVARPKNLEDVAFWPVSQLAALIRTRQATAVELTEMYLGRLKRYDPSLKCVVTLTEDLAMRQARDADREIAAGRYRGPLHGIPWGVKDLCSVKSYPTTWGAAPFKSRVLDEDATVVSKLTAAGAVLVAKLTTGELALDDVWFGGQTKNPWDLSMGSQGSSAGPASAGAAGLVGFAVGTETGGSIVEPSGICGVSGLRPTFGRVSRHGVMTMSWSLDKLGPMCRSVDDCAVVLAAMQGPDDKDLSVETLTRRMRSSRLRAIVTDERKPFAWVDRISKPAAVNSRSSVAGVMPCCPSSARRATSGLFEPGGGPNSRITSFPPGRNAFRMLAFIATGLVKMNRFTFLIAPVTLFVLQRSR
jgi:hypothetical protein